MLEKTNLNECSRINCSLGMAYSVPSGIVAYDLDCKSAARFHLFRTYDQ